ncbi:MAG: Pr6Pr family membrane protein [Coprobacillus sp.]|nr:Pr6Pr family membrane protein [Coprobacillus sp.]
MVKSRIAQVVYSTIYVVLGLVGIGQSLGYFTGAYRPTFYIYFTNLSNYLCWIVMFIYMIAAIRMASKHEDGSFRKGNTFFFCCCISILLTCLVFNILLTSQLEDLTVTSYFGTFDYYGLHTLLPVLFILFWILFFEHKHLRWYAPILGVVIPLVYVGLIYLRAGIYLSLGETSETMTLYPYYFMNPDQLEAWEIAVYIIVLCVIFIGIGYLFVLFDNCGNFGKNKKNRKPRKNKGDTELATVDYGDISLEDESTFNEEITILDVDSKKKKGKK